jgi:hypothetical protein
MCQDLLNCLDQLFFVSVKIFKIETFQSMSCQDFCRDCQDKLRLSRFVETNQDLSRNLDILETLSVWKWQKVSTNLENLTSNMQNPLTSWSRLRQTVEKWQNFQVLMDFSISIETFGSRNWCRDEIEKYQSWSRFLDCWDKLFENVEIFYTVETNCLTMSSPRVSIETILRQIETTKRNISWCFSQLMF